MATGVVDAVFPQCLAEALRDAALNLSFDNHRIDHGADVVHAPIADHTDFARVGINLDFASVCAIAPGKTRRIIDRAVLKPELQTRWIAGRNVSGASDLRKADAPVRAGDGKYSTRESNVPLRGFEQVSGDPLTFFDDFYCRTINGGAADFAGTGDG